MQEMRRQKNTGSMARTARRAAGDREGAGSRLGRWARKFYKRRVYRNVKDRLFRFLFENDKEALLQLYNALNGTDYQNTSELQVVTIESAVYVVMKNDLAFVLAGTLNLYEHQSTCSPNLPVRFLIYLAEEYQKLIDQAQTSLYSTVQISLPTPQCVVFYNGNADEPEEKTLKLSDAFSNKERRADVELQVRMLNINYGHNEALMDKCRTLGEYAAFVEVTRRYIAEGMKLQDALNTAIDYCMEHEILYEVLKNHRAEVLGMLLEEFDVDKYERTLRQEGIQQGVEQGIQQGMDRANKLARILLEQDRAEDLRRCLDDKAYQKELLDEFGL